jgi:hypothetical protein
VSVFTEVKARSVAGVGHDEGEDRGDDVSDDKVMMELMMAVMIEHGDGAW